MKYNVNLPDESVNYSSENPLKLAIKLTLSLVVIAGILYLLLTSAIDYAVSKITPEQELRLEKILSLNIDLDKTSNPYLMKVTKKLTACAKLPYKITIHTMNDIRPNAFAVPGGSIYITKGMLKKVESENELAFIIGHELGHFKNRDHLRTLGYKLVLMVIGALLGGSDNMVTNITLSISDIKYSQKAELQADAFGLEVMNCAYGNVTNATRIFEKMDNGKEWLYFLATHPSFKDRIKKMKEKIIQDGLDSSAKVVPLEKYSR